MVKVPKVSVLVPVFNEPREVLELSLSSIMVQSFSDFECIVVDESTHSESARVCEQICTRDSRFRYIHPKARLGLPGSLNLAISMARGELLARFDSDDICMPDRLALQVEFLRAHPDISVCGGALDIISSEGKFLAHRGYPQTSPEIVKGMQLTTTIAHPTVMFRKEAIERHGGYNPDFRFAEDLDLWLRWLNAGLHFANLPQVLVHYRQNNTRRDQRHWRFNLRARISNFSRQYLVRRTIGIACIAMWVAMPKIAQEQIFKTLILRRS